MPPNRKGAFDTVDSLATLNVSHFVETSKFQPLTAQPPKQQQQQQHQNQHEQPAVIDTAPHTDPDLSAEDLANKAILECVLKEERLRIQFSADHILETIQKQQQWQRDRKDETLVRCENTNDDVADGYWDMPNDDYKTTIEKPTMMQARNKESHGSDTYWEWPSNPEQQKEIMIRGILQAEKHRQLFSVEHLEQNLLKEAALLKDKGEHHEQVRAPGNDTNDKYWHWIADTPASDTAMGADERAVLIESILEAENIRRLLSVEHIEENIMKAAAARTPTSQTHVIVTSTGTASSKNQVDDGYWDGF